MTNPVTPNQAATCKCGNPWLHFEHPEPDEWSVLCRQCSNEGPTCFTKQGAIAAWNHRITSEQPLPVDTELHDLIGEVYQRGYTEACDDAAVPADFYSEERAQGCAQVQADLKARIERLSARTIPEGDVVESVAEIVRQAISHGIEADRSEFSIAATAGVCEAATKALLHVILSAVEAERGWQPIETAPKEARGLLLWNGAWMGRGSYLEPNYEDDPVWFGEDDSVVVPPPTHWRPLPDPPIRTDGIKG